MFSLFTIHPPAPATKFRLVQHLIEGDPFAWSVVGGIIAIIVIVMVVRKARSVGQPAPADQRDDPVKDDGTRAGK